MKGYYGTKQLRLVGKGWEIRAKLRTLSARSAPRVTLRQWLGDRAADAFGYPEASLPGPEKAELAAAAAASAPLRERSSAAADYRSYPMV